MKYKFYFLLLNLILLFTLNVSGQVTKIDSITVTNSSIIINKDFTFSLPISPESLAVYLGKPRIDPGRPNTIYFWDTLGIKVYVPKKSSMIISFEICFSESSTWETTSFYRGKVIIRQLPVDRDMDKAKFTSLFPKKETKMDGELIVGDMSVLFEFDGIGDNLTGIAIYKTEIPNYIR